MQRRSQALTVSQRRVWVYFRHVKFEIARIVQECAAAPQPRQVPRDCQTLGLQPGHPMEPGFQSYPVQIPIRRSVVTFGLPPGAPGSDADGMWDNSRIYTGDLAELNFH